MSNKNTSGVILSRINPAIHPKYCSGIYRWLKHKRQRFDANKIRVYITRQGLRMIGVLNPDGSFRGHRLASVMRRGGAARSHFYAKGSLKLRELKTFWPKYMKFGMCFIHPEHAHGFPSDVSKSTARTRVCQWCGQKQKMRLKRIVKVEESWENV